MRTSLMLIVLSLLMPATLVLAAGSDLAPSSTPEKATGTTPEYNMATAKDGETVFKTNCQTCHMPAGEGAKGAGMYPALANNPSVATPGYTVHIVMNGLRGMPAYSSELSDEQIALVANFVASSFGNQSTGPVSAEDVKAVRPQKKLVYQLAIVVDPKDK